MWFLWKHDHFDIVLGLNSNLICNNIKNSQEELSINLSHNIQKISLRNFLNFNH